MSFSFLYVNSKKNPVSPYVIFYKKETDNISAQEGKKTGKIVYVNDNGEQAVIKDGVNGEIAAVLTVGREEIGEELKKEGCAGTDREIDIILNGGFRQYAEDQKGEIIGDAVCVAIGDAACRGQIEYADEYTDAKKRGHGVTLVRAEVRYKDTEDCEG